MTGKEKADIQYQRMLSESQLTARIQQGEQEATEKNNRQDSAINDLLELLADVFSNDLQTLTRLRQIQEELRK